MGLFDILAPSLLASGGGTTVIHECRECGTNVESGDRCPACDSSNVARYEL